MTLEVKDWLFPTVNIRFSMTYLFQAYAGDLIAIIGHNGIGKTTLSNILLECKKKKAGQILYIAGKMFLKADEKTLPILLCRIQIASYLGTV